MFQLYGWTHPNTHSKHRNLMCHLHQDMVEHVFAQDWTFHVCWSGCLPPAPFHWPEHDPIVGLVILTLPAAPSPPRPVRSSSAPLPPGRCGTPVRGRPGRRRRGTRRPSTGGGTGRGRVATSCSASPPSYFFETQKMSARKCVLQIFSWIFELTFLPLPRASFSSSSSTPLRNASDFSLLTVSLSLFLLAPD